MSKNTFVTPGFFEESFETRDVEFTVPNPRLNQSIVYSRKEICKHFEITEEELEAVENYNLYKIKYIFGYRILSRKEEVVAQRMKECQRKLNND